MGISEMSIETMIGVSRLLIAASVMLAVLTVLLFWGFQIPKCIRMVLGGYPIYKKKQQKTKKNKQYPLCTERLGGQEKTCLLDSEEETVLLGTMDLEMIQDIVHMQDTQT